MNSSQRKQPSYRTRPCDWCGTVMEPKTSREKHCSPKCRLSSILEPIAVSLDDCWNWPLSTNIQTGYGQFAVRPGFVMSAHRAVYTMFVGEVAHGMYVCHRCDNRRCVNPEHLAVGTAVDNSSDMVTKGRHAGPRRQFQRADQHWTRRRPELVYRKVDMQTAEVIAAAKGSCRAIGRAHGISHKIVSAIKRGVYFGSSSGSAAKTRILADRN